MATPTSHDKLIPVLIAVLFLAMTGVVVLYAMEHANDSMQILTVDGTPTDVGSSELLSSQVHFDDWRLSAFFSENANFYFYFPSDWTLSQTLDANYYNDIEGNKFWGNSTNPFDPMQKNFNFNIATLDDTGESLATWVKKKRSFLESQYSADVDMQEININGHDGYEVCLSGFVAEYKEPSCYLYLHQNPSIIEIKISQWASENYFEIQKLSEEIFSRFYLVDSYSDEVSSYYNYNFGYSIKYDPTKLPLQDDSNSSYLIFGSYEHNPRIDIHVETGARNSLEKYWYDDQVPDTAQAINRPFDLFVGGERCLGYEQAPYDYSNADENLLSIEVLCLVNDKLYRINGFGDNNPGAYRDVFSALRTLEFHADNAVASGYLYKNNKYDYSIQYPNNVLVSEEGGDLQHYVTFAISPDSNEQPHGTLIVGAQTFDGTITDCANSDTCLLYFVSLGEFADTQFRGLAAKKNSSPYRDDVDQVTYVLSRNGTIYNISLTTDSETSNTVIDSMFNSFQFL